MRLPPCPQRELQDYIFDASEGVAASVVVLCRPQRDMLSDQAVYLGSSEAVKK